MIEDVQAKTLRAPFAKEQIQSLPKTNKRPAIDYVSHGNTTDRLLQADPNWEGGPLLDAAGHPVTTSAGDDIGVFYRLTVGGVSRIEWGEGSDLKAALSDGLKRAAMRFGVALDLWIGEEARVHADPHGWPNAQTKREAHDAYTTALRGLSDEDRATIKALKDERGYGWPLRPEEHEALMEAIGAFPF